MTQTITPYLCVADASAALDWYRRYFKASVSNVIGWNGRVGHAEVEFSGAVFYLSDEAREMGVHAPTSPEGGTTTNVVLVAAVDELVARPSPAGPRWSDRSKRPTATATPGSPIRSVIAGTSEPRSWIATRRLDADDRASRTT